jgi:hypothetical protein
VLTYCFWRLPILSLLVFIYQDITFSFLKTILSKLNASEYGKSIQNKRLSKRLVIGSKTYLRERAGSLWKQTRSTKLKKITQFCTATLWEISLLKFLHLGSSIPEVLLLLCSLLYFSFLFLNIMKLDLQNILH